MFESSQPHHKMLGDVKSPGFFVNGDTFENLRTMVAQNPQKVAIASNKLWLNYQEFLQLAQNDAAYLSAQGFGRYSRLRLKREFKAQFFSRLFAIYHLGGIANVDGRDWELHDLQTHTGFLANTLGYTSTQCSLDLDPYFSFVTLLLGATLIVGDKGIENNPGVILDLIAKYKVTSLFLSENIHDKLKTFANVQGLRSPSLQLITKVELNRNLQPTILEYYRPDSLQTSYSTFA